MVSNGEDWVSLFHDGRVKVASRTHLWDIVAVERHNALGQAVTLAPGRTIDDGGRTASAVTPDHCVALTPARGDAVAGVVAATNGTFVDFLHNGTVVVGNDGRDIAETFNTAREGLEGGASGRGGAVMVTFQGSYRPRIQRRCDFLVEIPEPERPAHNRLYPGEYEVIDGKIGG
ncbi:hypothetical protein A3Q40_03684 [Rhodococcus sp. PBTS 1]|nr:hypothetical protein A3Q40_03684 [Rhodococcus sp. PBTS 1]